MKKGTYLAGLGLVLGSLAGCGERGRTSEELPATSAHAAVLLPTVSPEFGIEAPKVQEEAGGQPRIACGISRCLLAFFVSDAVFAARMSKSGTPLDATPVLLGKVGTSNHSLAVAARGDAEFAVAWLSPVGTVAHVRRISSSNGALLETQPAEVGPASEHLALASDGVGYVLVARHQPASNNWQTRAHFFRNSAWQAGSLLLEDGENMFGRTAVGFGAGKYLIAWGNAEATRVDAASETALDAQPITYTRLRPGGSQSVIFDGQNFFVSWHTGEEMRGARIRASDGAVLDADDTFNQIPKSILIRNDAFQRLFPTSTWDGTHAVVFWTSLEGGTAMLEAARIDTINGRRVDGGDGSAAEFIVDSLESAMSRSDFFPSWALGYGSAGGFLAYARNGAGIRSRTMTREAGGMPRLDLAERVVSNGSTDQEGVAVASNGNRYLVAWTVIRTPGSAAQDLYCARLSASGAMIEPNGVLLAQDATDPVVASAGADYLVTWRSGAELLGRTVSDATGNAGAVRQITIAASGHAVASDAVRYLVAWRAGNGVYARRVSADGTLLDAAPLEIGYTTGAIAAAADRHADPTLRTFGVAYANRDAPGVSVRAVRSATGAVINPEVTVPSRNEPLAGVSMSSDGRKFVLAWLDLIFPGDYGIAAATYDPYANALDKGETHWVILGFQGLPPPRLDHDGRHHLLFQTRSNGDNTHLLWARRMTTELMAIDDEDVSSSTTPSRPKRTSTTASTHRSCGPPRTRRGARSWLTSTG